MRPVETAESRFDTDEAIGFFFIGLFLHPASCTLGATARATISIKGFAKRLGSTHSKGGSTNVFGKQVFP